jgi:hypothetical protein
LLTGQGADVDGGLSFAQLEESMRQVEAHAYDLPTVHWRGLDVQEEFVPPSNIRRPTRCGLFDLTALVAGRRELVTCEQCRELVAADDADAYLADVASLDLAMLEEENRQYLKHDLHDVPTATGGVSDG